MPAPADYVDVAERIREFKALYPDGTLQSVGKPEVVTIDGKSFIWYCAAAYRTPDDTRPGIGWAGEPVPGPTPFTRDSELMNAETSAWGRAIVALGFETKKIASAQEVRNRQQAASSPGPSSEPPAATNGLSPSAKQALTEILAALHKEAPDVDWKDVARRFTATEFNKTDSTQIDDMEAAQLIAHLDKKLQAERVPFG